MHIQFEIVFKYHQKLAAVLVRIEIMKTRKRRLTELCNCSPDVGDCPRCVKGVLKQKKLQRRRITKRLFTKSRVSKP